MKRTLRRNREWDVRKDVDFFVARDTEAISVGVAGKSVKPVVVSG